MEWLRRRRLTGPVASAALTVAIDVFLFSNLVARTSSSTGPANDARTLVFAAVALLVLSVRRRGPVVACLVLCGNSVVATLLAEYASILPVCVALGTVAAHCDRRTAAVVMVVAVMTSAAWILGQADTAGVPALAIAYLLFLVMSLALGRWHRAGQRRVSELDRRRREAAREAVEVERRRVARELHDILAYTVRMMVLQAAGARRVLRSDPTRADNALAVVEEAGAQAMGELRRLLSVLPADDGPVRLEDEGMPERQPGLAQLEPLIESARRSGLHVDLDVRGESTRVDPSVALAAYRVVEEALQNVAQHAGPGATARVSLQAGDDALVVEVRDDGRGSGQLDIGRSGGHGLLGLAERVSVIGGGLTWGPGEAGGFSVTATLPAGTSMEVDQTAWDEADAVQAAPSGASRPRT